MTESIGNNRNTNDTATVTAYTVNSTTATMISAANLRRINFSACLDPGTTTVDVYIRYYPASTDNIKRGDVITRDTFSNSSLFRPVHSMCSTNKYTGEISAISMSGSVVIHVTEY